MIVKVRNGMLEFVERSNGEIDKVIDAYANRLGCEQVRGMEVIDLGSVSGMFEGYINTVRNMNCAVLDKGMEIQDLMQNAFQAGMGVLW